MTVLSACICFVCVYTCAHRSLATLLSSFPLSCVNTTRQRTGSNRDGMRQRGGEEERIPLWRDFFLVCADANSLCWG